MTQESGSELIGWVKDKLTTAKVESEKKFSKEDYQLKRPIRCARAIVETETDLDIIDQALKTIPRKRKRKQEQLSFGVELK